MLGKDNVAGPTLSSLSERFGIAPLIGKPFAIISDARLSGRSDAAQIAERLLSISGEDAIDIDRKNKDAWHGTLPTRFLILTNELPRLADASGALVSRFIVLCLTESFYGKEDRGLTNKLLACRSGTSTGRWTVTTGSASEGTSSSQNPPRTSSAVWRTSAARCAPSSETAAPSEPATTSIPAISTTRGWNGAGIRATTGQARSRPSDAISAPQHPASSCLSHATAKTDCGCMPASG
jgi:hypothetical protein